MNLKLIMDTNNFFHFFRSKTFVAVIVTLLALAVLVMAFGLGAFIGYRKANFSFRWGENYHQNFGGPRQGFFNNFARDFSGRDFIEGHGIFGEIIKIDGQALIIRGRENVERAVLVKSGTSIRQPRGLTELKDLKVGDYVTIIGEPSDSGQIEAEFIRVMIAPAKGSILPTPPLRLK